MHDPHQSEAKLAEGPTPIGAGLWAGLHVAAMVLMLALAVGAARAEPATTGGATFMNSERHWIGVEKEWAE